VGGEGPGLLMAQIQIPGLSTEKKARTPQADGGGGGGGGPWSTAAHG
jgi:hypothetical protein